jgi:hypothetical protein
MLVSVKLDAELFEGVCRPSTTTAHLHDPPPPPHDSRIDSRGYQAQQGLTGQAICYLPRSFDEVTRLAHKLVDVVIVTVVYAVDVA